MSLLSLLDHPTIARFAFEPGRTPLSTLPSVLALIAFYLCAVVSIKTWIARRHKPFHLVTISVAYNTFLALASLLLLVSLVHCVGGLLRTHSLWSVLCDAEPHQHHTGAHVFVYYAIYLSKLFEFLDTFLLCLRGKRTPFIHLYHHAITLFFAFMHLHDHTCIYWTMAAMNLLVHVFLYSYFALHELGQLGYAAPRRWTARCKRYLTTAQVAQFYATLVPCSAALAPRVLHAIDPALPFAHACSGTWRAAILGIVILGSYLYLFQKLLHDTYHNGKNTKTGAVATGVDKTGAAPPFIYAYTPDHQVTHANMWTPPASAAKEARAGKEAAAATAAMHSGSTLQQRRAPIRAGVN